MYFSGLLNWHGVDGDDEITSGPLFCVEEPTKNAPQESSIQGRFCRSGSDRSNSNAAYLVLPACLHISRWPLLLHYSYGSLDIRGRAVSFLHLPRRTAPLHSFPHLRDPRDRGSPSPKIPNITCIPTRSEICCHYIFYMYNSGSDFRASED